MNDLNQLKAKLKAYFTANSWNADVRDGSGCESCGYGESEGFSIERIQDLIDKFDPEKIS